MNCVDVATNLSSYILVLDAQPALAPPQRRRRVREGGLPEGRLRLDTLRRHPHRRRGRTQKYAVDRGLLASGKPPEITEVEKWYIDDNDIPFGAKGKVASAGEPQEK